MTNEAYQQTQHPQNQWGDPIGEERAHELQQRLDAWAANLDHAKRIGPFEGVEFRLTGADVFWLTVRAWASSQGGDEAVAEAQVRRAAEDAGLSFAPYQPALHLEGADLRDAHLERAFLRDAHLERAFLRDAHLHGAILIGAHLEGAILSATHLEEADLGDAYLEGAILSDAHLEKAILIGTHLEEATLYEVHLEGADLRVAHLEGADLRRAWLDSNTLLAGATLDTHTRLGDIQWSGVGSVNLTQIRWARVPRLGDEGGLSWRSPAVAQEVAVRAYRQLAAQLRAQGLGEAADRYAYQAQVRQRGVLLRSGRLPQYVGSCLLALVAGYGYKPSRSALTYLLVIGGFAAVYALLARFGLTAESMNLQRWDSPVVLSVTSFHGRVFFAGGLPLTDWSARVGAVEATIGLLTEVIFIASFTQRFFGSK